MRNPWMSFGLSAANEWAGATRGFWTAEIHRQQTAMTNEMIRQIIDFWNRTEMEKVERNNKKSEVRAGAIGKSPTVRSRVYHADSRPMAAHRRMSVRWRHNQHRPGEQAGGALAAGIGQPSRLSKRLVGPAVPVSGAASASCRKMKGSLELSRPQPLARTGQRAQGPPTNVAPFRGTLCGAKRCRPDRDAGLLGNNRRHLPG